MKTPWSESRMRETRTSGLMSGGVETGPLKDTAPPLDSTRFLLNGCNCLGKKELWNSAKNSLFLRWCSAETSKRQAREAALSLRSAWFGIRYLSSLIHHVAGCPGLVPGWRSQTWLDKSMRIPYPSPGDSPACVLPWRGESPGERTVEQIFVAHKERHPGTRPGQPQISQIGTAASTLPAPISLCLASHRFSNCKMSLRSVVRHPG